MNKIIYIILIIIIFTVVVMLIFNKKDKNIKNEPTIGENIVSELPNKEQLILIYCRSGNRSKQAAKKLNQLGYTNLIEFGGIIDWKGEIIKE